MAEQSNNGGRRPGAAQKLLIIGMDAGTLDLIRPWAEEGLLPGFARFLRGGAFGRMRSTFPPITPPGWSSLLTGIDFAKRGLVGFRMREKETGAPRYLDSRSVKAWLMFEHMARHGLKCGSVNVPMTSPIRPLSGGLMVGSTMGMGHGDLSAPGAFHPPELRPLLEACGLLGAAGKPRTEPDEVLELPPAHDPSVDRDELYNLYELRNLEVFYRNRALLFRLLDEWDLDVLMFEVHETDTVFHALTRLEYEAGGHLAHAKTIKHRAYAVYKAVDDLLCDLIARYAKRGWALALCSDHGTGATDLTREEYLEIFTRRREDLFAPIRVPTKRAVPLDDTVRYLARSSRVQAAERQAPPNRPFKLTHKKFKNRRGVTVGAPARIAFELQELPEVPLELVFGFHYELEGDVQDLPPEDVPLVVTVKFAEETLLEHTYRVREDYERRLVWDHQVALPEGSRAGTLSLEVRCQPEAVAERLQLFLEAPRVRTVGTVENPEFLYEYDDLDGAELGILNEVGMAGVRLAGRDRAGPVPREEYDERVELLRSRLAALPHPRREGALFERVVANAEVVEGDPSEEPEADVLMEWPPARYLPLREAVEDDDYHMFVHHPEGVFALLGPGVKAGCELDPLEIIDFAPTCLHYLGLPVPDTMEGRVVEELFVRRAEIARETPPAWEPAEAGHELSLAERNAVEARLQDLGYL